jgi:hypothetical protein
MTHNALWMLVAAYVLAVLLVWMSLSIRLRRRTRRKMMTEQRMYALDPLYHRSV